jgi:protein phosphatase
VDDQAGLLIVADGMGGQQAGELASALAVKTIHQALRDKIPTLAGDEQAEELIRSAIQTANQEICARADQDPDLDGMGSTLVLALCRGSRLHIAHLGDSRAYLIHAKKIRQLTEDHTVVNQLLKARQIKPRSALRHPLRHVITRSLGSRHHCLPDLQHLDWEPGDFLLLCSDGLPKMLTDRRIKKTVLRGGDLIDNSCDKLLELALKRGGRDNITLILARHNPL